MKYNMISQVIILFFFFNSVISFHLVPGFTRRTIELKELSTPFMNHRVGHKIIKLNKGVFPLEFSKPNDELLSSMGINGKGWTTLIFLILIFYSTTLVEKENTLEIFKKELKHLEADLALAKETLMSRNKLSSSSMVIEILKKELKSAQESFDMSPSGKLINSISI